MSYPSGEQALSVTQVNQYVKALIEGDDLLSYVTVRGEISNLKYHTSGHLYFTLKDENAELGAVMFRSSVQGLRFSAKNGMCVTAYGRLSVYEKSGRYQMYVSAMTEEGIGSLRLEYERLYRKLSEEGLFDEARKRPLPRFPKCIGIVTSPTGAAIRDMIQVTGRRYPTAKLLIYPSLVQGAEAPESLCRGLAYLNAEGSADVIIIGRGGGSIEDLWAFNDEALVRAVAASTIPVISAVGHEIDFTLCDFAADQRAPTPSAAAELAVPDKTELLGRVDEMGETLTGTISHRLARYRMQWMQYQNELERLSPENKVRQMRLSLTYKQEELGRTVGQIAQRARMELSRMVTCLDAMNPLAILSRGYSVAETAEGKVVSSVEQLKVGERIRLLLADGEAMAQVLDVAPQQTNASKEERI